MQQNFPFQMPTQINFGKDFVQKIGAKTRLFGSRALIVAGAMAKNSGALQRVVDSLEKMGIECILFDRVGAQPRIQEIEEGARVGKAEKCEVVVGIGGECPMDAAKVIAALAQEPVALTEYFGMDKIKIQPLPIVAVPLTAGSGSEVTPLAAITTENDFPEIKIVESSLIYPTLAFVDPTFTLAFPEAVTVANGLDALSHSVEGIISENSQPLSDLLALESIRLVTQCLPDVLNDPKNMSYRSKLSYASLLAGIVVGQTGMGLAHHMGFYLTLDLGLKHGVANGLLLPWVLNVVLGRKRKKLETIANAFGADLSKLSGDEAIETVAERIRTFTAQFDIISVLNEKGELGEKIKNYSDTLIKNTDPSMINMSDLKFEEIEYIYRKALM
jgi:alcohol dehydrogenase class IV